VVFTVVLVPLPATVLFAAPVAPELPEAPVLPDVAEPLELAAPVAPELPVLPDVAVVVLDADELAEPELPPVTLPVALELPPLPDVTLCVVLALASPVAPDVAIDDAGPL
jgi:hypothetical protein